MTHQTRNRREGVEVTVLVLLRDEERHVEEAVAAMRAQTFEGSVEFLLLDGGSKDSTLDKLERLIGGDARFQVEVKTGWSIPQRLNHGLRIARGALIARMDAHAVFPPNYLSDGVRRLAAGDVASVSGPQVASGTDGWPRAIALALRSPLGRGGARFRQVTATEIDVDSGYCGIWTRELLLAHGGWNERALKGEDMELAFRVRRAGGRIVCVPSMAARYAPRETLGLLALQYWRYAERRAWAASLDVGVLRRSHLLPPAFALTVVFACAAPGQVARRARRLLGIYSGAVIVEAIRLGRGRRPSDVVALPAIFLIMHLAWGFGFLFGCIVNGWPTIARLMGRPVSRDHGLERQPDDQRV
jgi:succinoglycan biosynthesis protein ExoA